jgi:hypothetical protein
MTTIALVGIVLALAPLMGIPAMSYKLCTRCQFVVSSKNKLCTTCGSKRFVACEAPADRSDEPVVLTMPHVRHVGSGSARKNLRATITCEHSTVVLLGHRSLRDKFAQYEAARR